MNQRSTYILSSLAMADFISALKMYKTPKWEQHKTRKTWHEKTINVQRQRHAAEQSTVTIAVTPLPATDLNNLLSNLPIANELMS